MEQIPCLNITFNSALATLHHALKEAELSITAAGFKNLDKAKSSISANRTTVFIYFDYDAEHFPIALKFTYKDNSLKLESLDACTEFGLEAIKDMYEARNTWNEWTSK